MTTQTKTITIYIANDGTEFTDEWDCVYYESNYYPNYITFYDLNKNKLIPHNYSDNKINYNKSYYVKLTNPYLDSLDEEQDNYEEAYKEAIEKIQQELQTCNEIWEFSLPTIAGSYYYDKIINQWIATDENLPD